MQFKHEMYNQLFAIFGERKDGFQTSIFSDPVGPEKARLRVEMRRYMRKNNIDVSGDTWEDFKNF